LPIAYFSFWSVIRVFLGFAMGRLSSAMS
jgi:hypothetical protein